MQKRKIFLGFTLLATVIAALYPKEQNELIDIVEEVSAHPIRVVGATQFKVSTELDSSSQSVVLQSRQWLPENDIKDLFYQKPKVVAAIIPPPVSLPAVVEVIPTQPEAPPLPFTYLGKMVEENKLSIYASKAGRNYILKEGNIIEGLYSVKSIDQEKVVFEYLPLKQEQVLIYRGAI